MFDDFSDQIKANIGMLTSQTSTLRQTQRFCMLLVTYLRYVYILNILHDLERFNHIVFWEGF